MKITVQKIPDTLVYECIITEGEKSNRYLRDGIEIDDRGNIIDFNEDDFRKQCIENFKSNILLCE